MEAREDWDVTSPGRGMIMLSGERQELESQACTGGEGLWKTENIPWMLSCCFFEHLLASPDDVYSLGAIFSKGFGHHPTYAGATAGDDGDDAFDAEEIGGLEGRRQ